MTSKLGLRALRLVRLYQERTARHQALAGTIRATVDCDAGSTAPGPGKRHASATSCQDTRSLLSHRCRAQTLCCQPRFLRAQCRPAM